MDEGRAPDLTALAAVMSRLHVAAVATLAPHSDRMATGTINALLDVILGLDDPWPTVRREPAQQLTKIAHYRDLD